MDESKTNRRWYRLSPDRLILGLLGVEILLLLSEQFQWFAFNEKKGWTVLIAVAAVGLVVVVMLLWLVASFLFRLRFQFSVRSLVVLVVTVAIPSCWFASKLRQAERQRKAVEAIHEAEGWVHYDHQYDSICHYQYDFHSSDLMGRLERPHPAWLRSLVGVDFCSDIIFVELSWHGEANDAALENLEGLREVLFLEVSGPEMKDEELNQLRGLTSVEWLELHRSEVTVEGLRHLDGLPNLKHLVLDGTPVTWEDTGELRRALPNCKIYWAP